jgi:two-component system sensor histidine kinase UhpB
MARYFFVFVLTSLVFQCFSQITEDSLLSILNQDKRDTTQVRVLLELGSISDEYEKAVLYYHQALLLIASLKNKEFELAAYQGLTKLNRSISHPDSAFYYGEKAIQLAETFGNANAVADVHIDIGNVYLNTFNYLKALSEFIAAAEILDSLKTNPKSQMTAYANIGNVQFLLENYDKSIDYMNEALLISKEIKYDLGTGYCYKTLGRIYRKQRKFELATQAYQESLFIYTRLDNKFQLAEVRLSLGNLYFDTNQFNEALEEYGKSLSINKSIQNDNQNAFVYAAIGATWNVLENYPKATVYFDSTLMAAKGVNPYLEMDSYQNLAEISEKMEAHKQALVHFKRFSVLRDSITELENRSVAEEIEAKYQNTAKQNEIEQLKKEKELQEQVRKANTFLISLALISIVVISTLLINRYRVMNRIKRQAELERMRQNIARDLHDDIGSTLSSINIMSKVAMNQVDNLSHLQKISTYSGRMMETMSDMVWSINPVNDSVEQMIVKMKEFAGEILEPKNMQYDFTYDESVVDIRLDVEKRKSIFLIFKEAINNTAKYSEATQVVIQLNRTKDTLTLKIQDNGKGFDSLTVTRGNGLRNMAARAQGIKGISEQMSEPGKGTTISVQVPIT